MKLNSLILADLFVQKVKIVVTEYATDLHCQVIYHLVNEFNTSDYRTAQHWLYECLRLGCTTALVVRMFMSCMRVCYMALRQLVNSGGCSDYLRYRANKN